MRYAYLLMGLLLTSPVFAYGALTAKVIQVRVDRLGQGMVVFDASIGGSPPACVTSSYANAFAFDANTAGGKAILAMALSAHGSGALITVYGTNACTTYGDWVEDWSYGVIQPT